MENPTEQNNPQKRLLKRRGLPFAAVEHLVVDDPRVSRDTLVIYLMLCRYADWNTGVAFPSVELIRTRLKMRKQDIVIAIKELEKLNYLKVQRRPGRKSIYEVGPEVKPVTSSQAEPHQFPGGTGTSSDAEPEQEISNKRHITREEEPAEPSPSSQPLPQETDLSSGGNGQGKRKGHPVSDPVILAYCAEHLDLFGFKPQINFAAAGGRLKALRTQFIDDQLVRLLKAARRDEDAWYRRDRKSGKPTYDLLTLLSSDAINQIQRNHPGVMDKEVESKPNEHPKCPCCGYEVLGDCCRGCGWSPRSGTDPETLEAGRIRAMAWGKLPVETKADQQAVEAFNNKIASDLKKLGRGLKERKKQKVA